MTKTRSMAVWLGETLSEAVSTTILMTVLAFIEAERPIHNDLSFRLFAGMSVFVLLEFAITGYLVTTAIAAFFLPLRGRFLYPAACSCLYLLHSEIFFVGVGNPWFYKRNVVIQVGGAFLAFMLTLLGDRMRLRA
jgi:hypothetical protein